MSCKNDAGILAMRNQVESAHIVFSLIHLKQSISSLAPSQVIQDHVGKENFLCSMQSRCRDI